MFSPHVYSLALSHFPSIVVSAFLTSPCLLTVKIRIDANALKESGKGDNDKEVVDGGKGTGKGIFSPHVYSLSLSNFLSLVVSAFLISPCLLTVKIRTDASAFNEKGGGGGGSNDFEIDQGQSSNIKRKAAGSGNNTVPCKKRASCYSSPSPPPYHSPIC